MLEAASRSARGSSCMKLKNIFVSIYHLHPYTYLNSQRRVSKVVKQISKPDIMLAQAKVFGKTKVENKHKACECKWCWFIRK